MRYTQPQAGPLEIDWGNPLTRNLQLLLVKSRAPISLMTSLLRGTNTGGGYGTAGVNQAITPYGVFQTHGGGGYADDATLASGSISTDAYGLFGFCLFYVVGVATAASQLFHISSAASGEDDGTVTLNTTGTLTITANGNINTTTGAVVNDGLHFIVFGNDRTNGIQELWLDGSKISTWSSTAQSGFSLNYIKTGQSAAGAVSIGMVGMGLGRGQDYATLARALHNNPWQLFKAPRRVLRVASGGGTTVNPGVGNIALTGYAPTLAQTTNQSVTPNVGSVAITGYAPSIAQPQTAAPGVGSIALTGYAPAVVQNEVVAPGVGSLVLTGYAPTLAQTANQALVPGVGSVSITGYAPTVVQAAASQSITPNTGALALTGYAPIISQTGRPFGAPLIAAPQPRNWIGSTLPRNWEAGSTSRNWTSNNNPRNWIATKD